MASEGEGTEGAVCICLYCRGGWYAPLTCSIKGWYLTLTAKGSVRSCSCWVKWQAGARVRQRWHSFREVSPGFFTRPCDTLRKSARSQ